jgi:hypothetical protein
MPAHNWNRRDRSDLPVVATDEFPPTFVHQPMMAMTQEH